MNRFFAAVSAALIFASCSSKPPPSVLFVTFDTTRYDHIGANGDPEAKTPTVDALASQGLRFERAYASVALTLPSHTTMMTGLEPIEHGVHNNGKFRVSAELETLAERLKAAGYETAAVVSAFVLDGRFRLDQGFDLYSDDVHESAGGLVMGVSSRTAQEVASDAIEWLEARRPEKPFFLWTHFYDPHQPLHAPPPYDKMPSAYAAEITYADAELARVLERARAKAGDRGLLVVFTADHGESLDEHEEKTHGIVAYDSTLHVPLILAGPGVPSGERSQALAKHADLYPTILHRVGLSLPERTSGRDLLATWNRPEADAIGYFESRGPHFDLGWSVIEGVRTARWKFTAAPEPKELYDIESDPRETANLITEEPDAAREMEELFKEYRESIKQAGDARIEESSLEAAEQLAALGYVQAPQEFDASDIPDPRKFVRIHSWIDDGRMAAQRGAFREAIDLLETLRESRSVKALVLRTLAPVYGEVGRTEDGIKAFDEYIRLTGAQEAKLGRARLLLNAGRNAEVVDTLAGISGESPIVVMYRAFALARLGKLEEARRLVDGDQPERRRGRAHRRVWSSVILDAAPVDGGAEELRELYDADPSDALVRSRYGYYLAVWGGKERAAEGVTLLESAAAESPRDASLASNLGWGAYSAGNDPLALEWLRKALSLDPMRNLDRFRLAYPLRRTGEIEQARYFLQRALAIQPGASWAPTARKVLAEVEAEVARLPKSAKKPAAG